MFSACIADLFRRYTVRENAIEIVGSSGAGTGTEQMKGAKKIHRISFFSSPFFSLCKPCPKP